MTASVLALADCTGDCAQRVGGKALGLGRLLEQSLEVPDGFVVTTDAYREWLAAHGLDRELARLLAGACDPAALGEASRAIDALFERAGLDDGAIDAAYAELDGPVAVRSSATAEDTEEASFAGQQETYLWIVGADDVRRHVVRCWASLFTPQAISYRRRLGIDDAQVAMAVVVQRMVAADAAGVLITLDPVSGDRSQIAIESAHGLGLPVVGGELTPDRFAVDKVTLEIRSRAIATKPFADRFDARVGGVRRVDLPAEEAAAPSLTDDDVVALARLGKRIERAFGGPMDVEWAIGPGAGERELHLLQARPETVWRAREAAPTAAGGTTALERIAAAMAGAPAKGDAR